jgi:plastocyanin
VTPSARRRRAPALAAATSVLVAVAGCGGSEKSPTTARTPTPAPAPATTAKSGEKAFAVTESEYSLSPANPDVPTGSFTISVRNAGATQHALEVEGPAGEVKTGTIEPGATTQLEVKLTKPGRYDWYCPIDGHRGRGMRGTIVVAGGGSAGSRGKRHDGSGKSSHGSHDSGSGGDSGRSNGDSSRSGGDSGGSGGDSGGVGPSNDQSGGYMPG